MTSKTNLMTITPPESSSGLDPAADLQTQEFWQFFEISADGLLLLAAGKIMHANAAAVQMFRVNSYGDLQHKSISGFLVDDTSAKLSDMVDRPRQFEDSFT